MYIDQKEESIMTIDVDNKLKLTQQQQMLTGSTAEIKSTPINVPIGQQNVNTDILTKLGITEQEYVNLCNTNPDFSKLSFDEQLKYIQNKKTVSENTTVSTPEIAETSVAASAIKTVEPMSKETIIKEYSIDKAEFNKMSVEEKLNTYVTELAKNKFRYAQGNEKSLEAWNNLNDNERQQLINQAKKEYINIDGNTKKLFGGNIEKINLFLDISMSDLQAANYAKKSIDAYNKSTSDTKHEDMLFYLKNLQMAGSDQLSPNDKAFIEEHESLNEALNYLMSKKDPTHKHTEFCADQKRNILRNKLNNLTPVEAKHQYLQALQKEGKTLTDKQQKEFQVLDKFINTESGQAFIKKVKENTDNPYDVPDDFGYEIRKTEYGELYDKAKSSNERAFIVSNYLHSLENDPEKYKAAVEHYAQQVTNNNMEEVNEVIAYAIKQHNLDTTKTIVTSDEETVSDLGNLNADSANKEQLQIYAEHHKKLEETNPEAAVKAQSTVLDVLNADNPDSTEYTAMTSGSASEEIQKKTVDFRNRTTNKDIFNTIDKQIFENSNENSRVYSVETIHNSKIDDDTKLDSIKLQTSDGNANVTKAAGRQVSGFDDEHEQKAAEVVYSASEKLSKEDAIEVQTIIADQIQYCAAKNQAEIHKMVSQSKYEEVVQHAAENIYKYDESAQKDALKYTLQTGNEKAIESAISNIDKCKGISNETSATVSNQKGYDAQLAKEIKSQQAKIEQKYTIQVADQYADYMVEQDLRSGIISQESAKSQREKYVEEFKNPNSNKFALLGKLEPGQKKEALKILVKFAPTLINSFIDMGYGAEILRVIGETSDLAEKIIKLMDFKGQPEAKAIVMKHPDKFEDLYLKYAKLDENPPLAHTIYTTTPPAFTNLLKRTNQDGRMMFKI